MNKQRFFTTFGSLKKQGHLQPSKKGSFYANTLAFVTRKSYKNIYNNEQKI